MIYFDKEGGGGRGRGRGPLAEPWGTPWWAPGKASTDGPQGKSGKGC